MKFVWKLFDKWCEWMKNNGRMYVIVHYTGHIFAYRYYPMIVEKTWSPFKYPNMFFHIAGDAGGPMEMHSHPWSLISFILRGQYTHICDGKLKSKFAPSMIFVRYPKKHAIFDVVVGTTSLVIHWFKREKSSENFYNSDPDKRYGLVEDCLPHSGVAILKWTPEIQKKIEVRKAANIPK